MFVVVGVVVDDVVGAVWLAFDANTSAHTSMVVVVVVVVGIVVVVGQRFAALVVQRFAALVSVHVRRPLVVNCSLGRYRP
jgi:biotin transporter BioY